MVFGELPNISSKAKSIGFSPFLFSKQKRWSPVTFPTSYIGERSRSATFFSFWIFSSPIIKPIRSWLSLPIISLEDRVGSPMGSLSKSILPPVSSTNSLKQFRCPPAPWSWMETMGLLSLSTIARMAFAARFCISGLLR